MIFTIAFINSLSSKCNAKTRITVGHARRHDCTILSRICGIFRVFRPCLIWFFIQLETKPAKIKTIWALPVPWCGVAWRDFASPLITYYYYYYSFLIHDCVRYFSKNDNYKFPNRRRAACGIVAIELSNWHALERLLLLFVFVLVFVFVLHLFYCIRFQFWHRIISMHSTSARARITFKRYIFIW